MADDAAARLAACEAAAATVQCNFDLPSAPEPVRRVAADVAASRLLGAALFRVPADYYSRPLAERATLLGCPVDRLCKTIVLENAAAPAAAAADAPLGSQRYVAVVLQYVTRLDMPALERLLRRSAGAGGDVKLRQAADAPAFTGFMFNAVTPWGSCAPLPVVVTKQVAALASVPPPAHLHPYVWLGGGAEDVKLRLFLPQLLRSGSGGGGGVASVTVLDVAVPRGAGDDDEDDAGGGGQ
jgi:prolyl-tRNA editing enzyme YbaK/EbsC (Cys-tRNA(Pro) deacylase)